MKMKKLFRLISLITVVILLLSAPIYADETSDAISVTIDGIPVMFPDAQPFIKNGRTMIPIRFISENMGGKVSWNQSTKTATIKQGNITIVLTIGNSSAAVVDSSTSKRETKLFDAAPVIKDSRTFVPLRFVSETMGCGVSWNGNTRTVAIRTDGVMTEKLGKSDINVSVNSKTVIFEDVKPVLKSSDIFVPVRAVADAMGADISLNSSTDDITLTFNENKLQFINGMKAVFVNGQAHGINDSIFITNNRLMVPLKFMAEKLGCEYKWNTTTNTAELTADYTPVTSKDNTVPESTEKFVPYLPELTPMDEATKAVLMKYPENKGVGWYNSSFYVSNAVLIKGDGKLQVEKLARIAKGLEETIYNADYRTVDENYVKQLKYFYMPGMSKNEDTLGPWAERYAKEIIKYKIIVKGEFITDSAFVYQASDGEYRVRGRMKFNYISASKEFFVKYKQPEFKFNTWYYQDMEICLAQQFSLGKESWEHAIYTFSGEVDHTDYIEVK